MAEKPNPRCAVYTRKSTEDGLDQAFNSLDAQYEACSAYALSQRHEGWVLLPERYDDGGFSGGSIERPAFQRLLADVAAGKVDVVLVYKVDRLTRSLSDFARIVEVLDKAGASFVSITQPINSATSMGRLMLNVLLSFAQFEREMTGERIRDKIAASKRKGLWMGGPVPLGYRVEDRKLAVDETEAELVRLIMRRYLALGSVRELIEELEAQGHRTKVQHMASGPHRGSVRFRRGTLYHLLANRIYVGDIVHKGQVYPGEHPAIVPAELWDEVQTTLKQRASGEARRLRHQQPSLLTGRIEDGLGRPMSPSHATKPGKRYRYYVTRPDALDGEQAWRVSAHDLEALVRSELAALLTDAGRIHDMLSTDQEPDAQTIQRALAAADMAAATLRSGAQHERATLVSALVERVSLVEQEIRIAARRAGLLELLGCDPTEPEADAAIMLVCEAVRIRRGHELRLVIPGPVIDIPAARVRDEKLVALIAEAQAARELVLAAPDTSIARIAADASRCRTRLAKLVAISALAPDIVAAIVQGKQPATLTAAALLRVDLPLAWGRQRELLGVS